MSYNVVGLQLTTSFKVMPLVTFPALAIACWGAISVCFRVFMPVFAVRFVFMVWRHCQSFKENAAIRIKNLLHRHKLCGSLNDCVGFETANFSKDSRLVFDALYYNGANNASIKHLIFFRCPSAIRRLVISVRINPVYGISLGTFAHVLHKSRKAICPSFTNLNSSASIKLVCLILGVQASLFNLQPGAIENMTAHRMFCPHGPILEHAIKNGKEVSSVV